jgi:hypothetical protein
MRSFIRRHLVRVLPFAALVALGVSCADAVPPAEEPGPEETLAPLRGGPGRACGTRDLSDLERAADEARMAARRGGPPSADTVVPVHFHVMTSGALGQVTDAQIADQIDVLNDAYQGSGFSFALASTNRYESSSWFKFKGERKMKSKTRIGDARDLNIWTGDGGSYLGWATFPSSYAHSPTYDGVVIDYRTLPDGGLVYEVDGQVYTYDLGDTTTHEVGHWLGLYHTFQGGCGGSGDEVSDTPDEGSPDYDCTEGRDTCAGPGLDPIHNFMDYSDDVCLFEFTAGQHTRTVDQWATYRASGGN